MILETLQTAIDNILSGIKTFIETDLPKMIIAAIIMVVASYLSRQAGELVKRALKRRKADPGVTTLLVNLTRWSIIATGLFFSIGLFTNVSSLLTTLGLVGFAISFAFQDVLKNLVAGIIILIQHPFNVGESVNLGGYEGTVVGISSRMTEIKCFDGTHKIILNSWSPAVASCARARWTTATPTARPSSAARHRPAVARRGAAVNAAPRVFITGTAS